MLSAGDLPYEKNVVKTSFNCDPFAVISYGKTTFRTKIIRHSLNPVWNQTIHLHVKKSDLINNWPVRWCIYDFERFTKNNAICEVDIPIVALVQSCDKPMKNLNRPSIYNPVDMKVDLAIKVKYV